MTAERWRQIEQLYHAALEQEADQRLAFLTEACAGDSALRQEIETLLAANDQAGGFLNGQALTVEARKVADERAKAPAETSGIEHFSHYRILSKLGAGGMGEVYLALDTTLERRVAIKILPACFTTDAERLQRFAREARAASALNHPSIITIYEIGRAETESGPIHFISTEYVEGVTLRARLARGPMTLRETLDAATQIAAALDAAHRAGIIHRDIKPENLMLRPDGLVKVLDFGLAKLTGLQGPNRLEVDLTSTAQGTLLGTPRYMSPEQARGQKVDARSDLFSLGSVLYEMITGRPPFQGNTVADLFAAILQTEPPPLSQSAAVLPVELQRVVSRALAKDRDHRYQSARELQTDLQTLGQRLSANTLALRPEREASVAGGHDAARTTAPTGKVATSKFSSWTDSLASLFTLSAPGRAVSAARMIFATGVLAVLGLIAWLIFSPANRSLPPRELKFETLYTKAGQDNVLIPDSRFSPDGEMIAFAASGDGDNIWIRQIGSDRNSQITFGRWEDSVPIWSANGKKIAFVSNRNNELGIWTTLLMGSTPVLIKTLGGSETLVNRGTLRLLAWAKDESALYYEWNYGLHRLDLNSKESSSVLPPNLPFQRPEQFSFSPSQQRVAFIAQENKQFDIWLMELSRGRLRRISNDAFLDQTPLWAGDDKLLYNSLRNDRLQTLLTDAAGRQPTLIPTGDHQCRLTDFSVKSNRLLCYEQRDESNIFAVRTETGADSQLTDDLGTEFWATVSPDGRTLLYQAIQGDRLVWDPRRSLLLTKSTNGKEQSSRLAADAFDAQWAPAGGQIGFLRLAGLLPQLWVIPSGGGEAKPLGATNLIFGGQRNGPPYNRVHLTSWSWSPDGSQIAYCAQQDGLANVWTITADGARKTPISSNHDAALRFNCPLWSPDGQRLAYVSETSGKPAADKPAAALWVQGQEHPSMMFQTGAVLRLIGWLSNNHLLVALADRVRGGTSQPTAVRLFSIPAEGAAPNSEPSSIQVGALTDTYLSNLHLSPNGRVIAYVKMQNGRNDVWLTPLSNNRLGQEKKITNNSDPSFYFSSLTWSPDGKTIYYDKQTRWSLLTMVEGFN